MDAAGPLDLSAQRQQVFARVGAVAAVGARPEVRAATPLTRLAPATEGKYANLLQLGLGGKIDEAEAGRTSEVVTRWLPVVVGAVAIVLGVVTGHVYLIVIGVVFALLSIVRVIAVNKIIRSNPNNLSPAEVRTIIAARRWRSAHAWEKPTGKVPHYALVLVAADTAQRIADNPTWRSTEIDAVRDTLDLRAALASIDDAAWSTTSTGASLPDALVDRVAALLACANTLTADGSAGVDRLTALARLIMNPTVRADLE